MLTVYTIISEDYSDIYLSVCYKWKYALPPPSLPQKNKNKKNRKMGVEGSQISTPLSVEFL